MQKILFILFFWYRLVSLFVLILTNIVNNIILFFSCYYSQSAQLYILISIANWTGLLTVQTVYTTIIMASNKGKCQVCPKFSESRCSWCKLVFYCSKEHQKQDWPHHKESCTKKKYRVSAL